MKEFKNYHLAGAILLAIFLSTYFFRYERLTTTCPFNSTCSAVFDRWKQRSCFAFFGLGIACTPQEIQKLFSSDRKPTWAEAVEHFKNNPVSIKSLSTEDKAALQEAYKWYDEHNGKK